MLPLGGVKGCADHDDDGTKWIGGPSSSACKHDINSIGREEMLVLTRGIRQQICLNGQQVVVTVLDVRDGKVRLGIDAPRSISVVRQEVADQVGAALPASR